MEKTLTLKCSTSNNISEYLTLQLILTYLQKKQAKIYNLCLFAPPPQKTTL